jgi:hypothetical protein
VKPDEAEREKSICWRGVLSIRKSFQVEEETTILHAFSQGIRGFSRIEFYWFTQHATLFLPTFKANVSLVPGRFCAWATISHVCCHSPVEKGIQQVGNA